VSLRIPHGFRRDVAGSTTLEFAMTALAMVLVLIGFVELGIVTWSWQVLETAATEAARCAGINATSCKNVDTAPANTQNFASTTAQGLGLSSVTASNVTVSTGAAAQTACGTTATVVSVALTYQFGTAFLPPLPSSITASACYPLVTATAG
jgi:Flp pilus assembly protein TadG